MSTTLTRDRLRTCLGDVAFPVSKDALVEAAERKGDGEAVRALRAIPPADYANLTEVFGSVEFADDSVPAADKHPQNPIVDELGENRGS